jgi:hypothetical protein
LAVQRTGKTFVQKEGISERGVLRFGIAQKRTGNTSAGRKTGPGNRRRISVRTLSVAVSKPKITSTHKIVRSFKLPMPSWTRILSAWFG